MSITLYGLRTCDTVRRARAWLEAAGLAHGFHDHRAAGIDAARLEAWCDEFGWEAVLNRAGTTFRKLPEAARAALDRPRAVALMLEQPAMIKRPMLEAGGRRLLGFSPERYAGFFGR
jgi:arsenate reductase